VCESNQAKRDGRPAGESWAAREFDSKAACTQPENNMRYLARHGERKKRAAMEGLGYRGGIDGLESSVGVCRGAS